MNHAELATHFEGRLDQVYDRLTQGAMQEKAKNMSDRANDLSVLAFAKFHRARGRLWECSARSAKYIITMLSEHLQNMCDAFDIFSPQMKDKITQIFTELGKDPSFTFSEE